MIAQNLKFSKRYLIHQYYFFKSIYIYLYFQITEIYFNNKIEDINNENLSEVQQLIDSAFGFQIKTIGFIKLINVILFYLIFFKDNKLFGDE